MDEHSLVDFLAERQALAPFIAAGLGAVETTALLSALIPSTAILVAVGAAASTGAFPLLPIWVGATIGALIGSTLSYALGRIFGARLLAMWPLRDHPVAVARTRALFARWGGLAIIAGHFIGPLRPVMFLFAGLSGMRFRVFAPFNVIGAAAWAFAIPKSGELGGDLFAWFWRLMGF